LKFIPPAWLVTGLAVMFETIPEPLFAVSLDIDLFLEELPILETATKILIAGGDTEIESAKAREWRPMCVAVTPNIDVEQALILIIDVMHNDGNSNWQL